jgi:hypothetical protein
MLLACVHRLSSSRRPSAISARWCIYSFGNPIFSVVLPRTRDLVCAKLIPLYPFWCTGTVSASQHPKLLVIAVRRASISSRACAWVISPAAA